MTSKPTFEYVVRKLPKREKYWVVAQQQGQREELKEAAGRFSNVLWHHDNMVDSRAKVRCC